MAKGGGIKGGGLKTPWFLNQGFFRHFSSIFLAFFVHFSWKWCHNFLAFFVHFSWKWCHEKCLKISWFKNQGIFRDLSGIFLVEKGIFKNPPFCAPTLCHPPKFNRQSPIGSVQRTRSTLARHSAVPCRTNVKHMSANCAIRAAAQRTQGLWGLISACVFEGDLTANES